MKPRGYKVRIDGKQVVAEHRTTFSPRRAVCIAFASMVLCLCTPHRGLPELLFLLLLIVVPTIALVVGLLYRSLNEVLICDAEELHFAKRNLLGRWHRFQFSSTLVQGFQRVFRKQGRDSIPTLTFQYAGHTFYILDYVTYIDSERILNACKSMGIDTISKTDDAAAMLRDIDKRGWFVNPLRPDPAEDHTTTHSPS